MGRRGRLLWTLIPSDHFRRGWLSGWGVRRALREGKSVGRTEKNKPCGSGSGTLLRRSEASGPTGFTRGAGELDAAEMYCALIGGREATLGMRVRPLGIMPVGGMDSRGARLLDAARHGPPSDCGVRETRGNPGTGQLPDALSHA